MIHAWGITDKGAVRTQNQDGFYLDVPSEHLAVGVVCDGMGGAKAGNVASLVAVETFVDALKEMGSQEESRPGRSSSWDTGLTPSGERTASRAISKGFP